MRVVVIGAGMSGLVAARALSPHHQVIVVDKGRSVGGRLATRRIGGAVVDHGAQFFTARGAAFRSQVDDWLDRSVARVWCHGFGDGRGDGHPRYVGVAGMNSLAKDLALGLDCHTSTMVFSIRPSEDAWSVVIDDGSTFDADAVVVTSPLPQSWSLLAQAEIDLPDELFRTDYQRTIALLAVLDRPSAVPAPGGVQFGDAGEGDVGSFSFIGDNQAKGVSPVPAVTFHATARWSAEHWDDDTDALAVVLAELASPWLGDAEIVEAQVKRWRFATPTAIRPERCWVDERHRIVLAGDVFAGPRVEGAFDSGTAAANAVESTNA